MKGSNLLSKILSMMLIVSLTIHMILVPIQADKVTAVAESTVSVEGTYVASNTVADEGTVAATDTNLLETTQISKMVLVTG